MKYKARVSFCGAVSMCVGEEREIADAAIAKDLVKAGYIVEMAPAEKAKVKATTKKAKRG